jgi:hypothetical protein
LKASITAGVRRLKLRAPVGISQGAAHAKNFFPAKTPQGVFFQSEVRDLNIEITGFEPAEIDSLMGRQDPAPGVRGGGLRGMDMRINPRGRPDRRQAS